MRHWSHIRNWRENSSLKCHLTIFVECSLNLLPQKNFEKHNIPTVFTVPGETVIVESKQLAAALLRLPKKRRKVLFLRYYLGYSDIEIGKMCVWVEVQSTAGKTRRWDCCEKKWRHWRMKNRKYMPYEVIEKPLSESRKRWIQSYSTIRLNQIFVWTAPICTVCTNWGSSMLGKGRITFNILFVALSCVRVSMTATFYL